MLTGGVCVLNAKVGDFLIMSGSVPEALPWFHENRVNVCRGAFGDVIVGVTRLPKYSGWMD